MQVTARFSDQLVQALDTAAKAQRLTRAELLRAAVERYLEDYNDLAVARRRLEDPNDPVLDWNEVRDALCAED